MMHETDRTSDEPMHNSRYQEKVLNIKHIRFVLSDGGSKNMDDIKKEIVSWISTFQIIGILVGLYVCFVQTGVISICMSI